MRVAIPSLLALLAFAGWIWLTGPGTSILIAFIGALIAGAVLFGSARLLNGRHGEPETGDDYPQRPKT